MQIHEAVAEEAILVLGFSHSELQTCVLTDMCLYAHAVHASTSRCTVAAHTSSLLHVHTYQLEGGCCSDMFVGVCCAPCSACQNVNECILQDDSPLKCKPTMLGNDVPLAAVQYWCIQQAAMSPICDLLLLQDCAFDSASVTSHRLYNIAGGCCGDICCTTWCYPCVATQLLNEVDKRGKINKSLLTVATGFTALSSHNVHVSAMALHPLQMVTLAAPVQQQAMYR
eukprot:3539-Heterococcus_DN1.PRE.1